MTIRPAGPRAGMSLLEVLISLMIFLMALGAIGQLVTISGEQTQEIALRSFASLKCQSKLAEVAAGALPLTSQPSAALDDDPDWNWALEVEPDNTPSLYRVKVTVSRTRPNGDTVEVSFSQFVFDPAQRGGTDPTIVTTDTGTDTGGTGTTTPSPPGGTP